MEITDVTITLAHSGQDDNGPDPHHVRGSGRFRAYATITIDSVLVVRDLKVVSGDRGEFVAMPSRKLADCCPHCRERNPYSAKYCAECGNRIGVRVPPPDERTGRPKYHADLVHAIVPSAREQIEAAVFRAYYDEVESLARRQSAAQAAQSRT